MCGFCNGDGPLVCEGSIFEADEMMQDWVSPARTDTIQMSRTGFERRLSTNTQARKPTKPIVLHLSIGRHTSRPAEVKVGSEHAQNTDEIRTGRTDSRRKDRILHPGFAALSSKRTANQPTE